MSSPDTNQVLLVRVGPRRCALPLGSIEETMRALPIAPAAGAPAFVAGVTVVRGEPTPVIDLGKLLGDDTTGALERFVTVRAGTRRVALAVQEVIGVVRLDPHAASAMPALLADENNAWAHSLAMRDRELTLILDAVRIVEAPGLEGLSASVPMP